MKILIVDDHPENLYMLDFLLKKNGYDVLKAQNGLEALELAAKNLPNLVISDILMPVMDGYSLCLKWSSDEVYGKIPFIFYSSTYTDKKSREFGLSLGAQRYILKPIEPDAFLEIIEEILLDFKKGNITNHTKKKEGELVVLKEYNEVLIHKLEQKLEQLAKTQVELKETDIRFRSILKSTSEGIAITDEKGVIIEWNPSLEKISGISANQVMGKYLWELISLFHVGNALLTEPFKKQIEELLGLDNKNLTPIPIENKYITPKAQQKFLRGTVTIANTAKGNLLFILLDDVTEKEEAERQLRVFEKAIEQSPNMVMITNGKGKIEFVNRKFSLFTAYTLDELKGKSPRIFNEGHLSEHDFYLMKEALKNKETWRGEFKNRKKNETFFWEDVSITPLLSSEGFVSNYIIVSEDITEKKQMLNDLIQARDNALRSNQLKTEFIHNMSHEIRTPMNGILGFLDFLAKPDLSQEKKNRYLQIIKSSGNQLLTIIDDILEISRLETKQVKALEEEVCVNDILINLFSIFDLKAKERDLPLYLKTKLSDEESTIISDKAKLVKIISNLLENALKFTFDGSIEFGYTLSDEKKWLSIYVKDTGIGIEKEKQEMIFERFSQADKVLGQNLGGLGLGLSIAKENTELIGGKITLESEQSKGTTFFVSIPYRPVFSEFKEQKSDDLLIKLNQKKTILIAEDEEVNFLFLEILIKEELQIDCELYHAKNGLEAVEMCKKIKHFDLILMDIKMPILNGIEATKKLRESDCKMPIIAQTAYTFDEDIDLALSSGCNDYLKKPIDKKRLKFFLDKYLAEKEGE